jgi:hypothetical protein
MRVMPTLLLLLAVDPHSQPPMHFLSAAHLLGPQTPQALNPGACGAQFLVEFMQLLSILRLARVQQAWSPVTNWVYSIIGLTPLSTASWISTDCMLPPGTSPAAVAYTRVLLFAVIVPGALSGPAAVQCRADGTGRAGLGFGTRAWPALACCFLVVGTCGGCWRSVGSGGNTEGGCALVWRWLGGHPAGGGWKMR